MTKSFKVTWEKQRIGHLWVETQEEAERLISNKTRNKQDSRFKWESTEDVYYRIKESQQSEAGSIVPEVEDWLDRCPVSYEENDVIDNSLWIILEDAIIEDNDEEEEN